MRVRSCVLRMDVLHIATERLDLHLNLSKCAELWNYTDWRRFCTKTIPDIAPEIKEEADELLADWLRMWSQRGRWLLENGELVTMSYWITYCAESTGTCGLHEHYYTARQKQMIERLEKVYREVYG